MRRAVLLALVACAGLDAETAGIQWFRNVKQGIEAARRSNKPLLIDFWADWCAPCKMMDTVVYTDPAVIDAVSRRVVAVRIHFDLQPDVARQFGVEALPNLLFADSLGTVLLRQRGLMNAPMLTDVLHALPENMAEINNLDEKARQRRTDPEALVELGERLRALGLYEASAEFLARAVQGDVSKRSPELRQAAMLALGLDYVDLLDGRRAVPVLERWVKEFPGSPRLPDALRGLVRAYRASGVEAKAAAVQARIAREFP
jgi:thiol-disulfide isomerase/thioredoxin